MYNKTSTRDKRDFSFLYQQQNDVSVSFQAPKKPLSAAQELLREARQLQAIRSAVANLCFSVQEQPEQNVS